MKRDATPIPNARLHDASNALDDLRVRLSAGAHDGRFLTPGEVAGLMGELQELRDTVRVLENEISAHRWNRAGRIDLERDAARAAQIAASDNVAVLVPCAALRIDVARLHDNDPFPGNGPEGGAA